MVTPTTSRATVLSPEEIGFLTAGPGRAAETALARLLDAGVVRVARDGRVSPVHQSGGGVTVVETRMLGRLTKPVQFGQVVQASATSLEMRVLQQGLRERKLIRAPRPRMRLWWIFLVIGSFLALAAITEPTLLVGTAALFGASWWSFGARPVTRAGRAAMKGVTADDRVLAVALHGFRGRVGDRNVGDLFGLPQSVVRTVPRKKRKRAEDDRCGSCGSGCGRSSCGTSGCSSGSSSCGGGGCGGGGGGD
ncbi:TIGR04222 domain-containing membrane protein [Lentzea sp. CC55]|uniref:TIGR04222 domain-containing membrane protein n=1 Tax=Lentzea sp. CC55 TaxID=2884909 RepID=UPI001F43322A|nr:TIGR04222 domain-containing membrane protein [Lentzea sp. CC55]MCG8923125.1 TIGR04222 domain-containing membrane protein [Lentzea sp. CC55]